MHFHGVEQSGLVGLENLFPLHLTLRFSLKVIHHSELARDGTICAYETQL